MTYRRAQKTKAGAPVDADFQVTAQDGLLAVDTTNKLLYYRAGGTWQSPATGGAAGYAPQYRSGNYYTFGIGGATSTHGLATLSVNPIWLPAGITLDRIGLELTTAGAATAVYRMGLYTDSGGQPSTLVAEYGTIDCTVTPAALTLTISQAISSSAWYWMGGATQGATCTVRASNSAQGVPFLVGTVATPTTTPYIAFGSSSGVVSGALPSTFPSIVPQNQLARFFVRVA